MSSASGIVPAIAVAPHAAIEVDSSDAPSFLRFTFNGEWPSLDDQRAIRDHLVSSGLLTWASRVLVDVRGITSASDTAAFATLTDGPVARVQAYLVSSPVQHQLARKFRQATFSAIAEIFVDEKDAVEWLWNADPDY
ncbi:MAG: hypothetical protein K2Y23_05280 [Cyanobacteria bacterium]|nr:hypothetical protein [Cyanobacteriota bacterium]